MNNYLANVKRLLKQLRGFLPSRLPNGMGAFDTWANDIADTYTLPTQDRDSIRFALATIIMHLGQTAAFRSKWYFVLMLRSSAAKQVAGNVFHEIKLKQQAAQAAAQHAEATALTAVASNEPQIKRV